MSTPVYIAIEGPIGVGKTTLARLIHKEFNAELLLEVFEENPFLEKFYADRERYAFQTQIFFLLSRFHQQNRVVREILGHSSLVSDYTFAKDRLFAHLNLKGDELALYEEIHAILADRIPVPNLVVYLRADTDVLMERIAFRDRPYERNMDWDYIDELRRAYEFFFASCGVSRLPRGLTALSPYDQAPVLTVDTNNLNYVRNPEDLAYVVRRIRTALQEGVYQAPLPSFPPD